MRKWSLLTVLLATTAIASSAGVGTADAYPKKVCDPGTKCRTVCRQDLANGNTVDYEEGATLTLNLQDGTKQKYQCKNGEWVRVRLVPTQRPFDFPKRK